MSRIFNLLSQFQSSIVSWSSPVWLALQMVRLLRSVQKFGKGAEFNFLKRRESLKRVLGLCAAALLVGCDTGASQSTAPKSLPVAANYFSKNAIYFPDGAGLQFSGKLRSYVLVEDEKGKFDRYVFEFSEDVMTVEGAVFATLAKSGYQRQVRREDVKSFVVDYRKLGFATVTMIYERVPASNGMEPFSRLRVTWKNT